MCQRVFKSLPLSTPKENKIQRRGSTSRVINQVLRFYLPASSRRELARRMVPPTVQILRPGQSWVDTLAHCCRYAARSGCGRGLALVSFCLVCVEESDAHGPPPHKHLSPKLYTRIPTTTNTYDQSLQRIRDPVRSPLVKLKSAGLVVGSVTTSDSPVLYVFLPFFSSSILFPQSYSQCLRPDGVG
jgi:hypothetical protein